MPEAKMYEIQRTPLGQLLSEIHSTSGSTLLIPNLQRPFVWKPDQVTLLVDSLIRGWPFATLLLWKINQDAGGGLIPHRSFWSLVDRTEEKSSKLVDESQPPGSFRMVLDGQQRLQSLLLAVGSDTFGFCLFDSDWEESLDGQPRRGRRTKHWTKAELYLDLHSFNQQMTPADHPRDVDYRTALRWAVGSPDGLSRTRQPPTYKFPLDKCWENIGRFIRLSRLWILADASKTAKQYKDPLTKLLSDHKVPDGDLPTSRDNLTPLLDVLGAVKSGDVSYLEVYPYTAEGAFKEDYYNEAVVNIFTRLNTAGRTLTAQEITFAWVKSNWKSDRTDGLEADECFAKFGEELEERGLRLSTDELVRVTSAIWSALANHGVVLGRRDLLRPEKIRPMAEGLDQRWKTITSDVGWCVEHLNDLGIAYRVHFESLNALLLLFAWKAVASEWRRQVTLKEPQQDAFDKQLGKVFAGTAGRWFALTQWSGQWSSASGSTFETSIAQLSGLLGRLVSQSSVEAVIPLLKQQLEEWLKPLEADALRWVDELEVPRREQIRQYFFPLWIWHRLDSERWKQSSIPFRDGSRKKIALEVDHLVAHALWGKKPRTGLDLNDQARCDTAINEIGNCWLLEKNFNISKSDQTLGDFLVKVHDFKAGELTLDDWSKPLGIGVTMQNPLSADAISVTQAITTRTKAIKDELKAFVRGEKAIIV